MDEPGYSLVNGMNVGILLAAREAISKAPESAKFEWRVQSDWIRGSHTRSQVSRFFGLGSEQGRLRQFHYNTDHPELCAAEDNGATPVEMVLVALAGCLIASIAAVASRRDIRLYEISARVQGEMDVQGVLGIDSRVRNGFDSVTVDFVIDANATDTEITAVLAQAKKRSAVFDIVSRSTDVSIRAAPRVDPAAEHTQQ